MIETFQASLSASRVCQLAEPGSGAEHWTDKPLSMEHSDFDSLAALLCFAASFHVSVVLITVSLMQIY